MLKDIPKSPVYLANLIALRNPNNRIIVNQGGARSGKTYSILQNLIERAYFSKEKSISIVSKTFPHLKRGAIRDFNTIMNSYGIYDRDKFHKTDHVYTFKPDTFIEFFSVENSEKLRGPSRHDLFINEANLLTYDEFLQLEMRSSGQIIIDYNPVDEFHWIYDRLLTRDDCKFIKSCYLDNYDFLSSYQIKTFERLKDEDPDYWKIFGMGEVAKTKNIIYDNWTVQNFKTLDSWDTIYGLDFGYTNPTALIEISNVDGVIYLKQLLYETHLNNSQLIEKLNEIIPNKFAYIYADTAEPDRIDEIYKAGFNIQKANKNVISGIDFCRRYRKVIHYDSVDLQKEFKYYKLKEDKEGKILEDPVKFNNHGMDAFRYGLYTHGSQYWINIASSFALPTITKNTNKKRNSFETKFAGYMT
jgi:phage terminase large subunit